MATRFQIYKCELCGNIVEVLHGAGGSLACCGRNMALLEEKTADAATEKHVPVIEKIDGGYKVTVGSVPHPMTGEHYIEWIELQAGDKTCRQYLEPGAAPEAQFKCCCENVTAREHCTVHGLWKSQ